MSLRGISGDTGCMKRVVAFALGVLTLAAFASAYQLKRNGRE
jgi:hypothetical protein